MAQQGVLFDKRFLESFAGHNILRSPRTAIVELVANAWDAGATRVNITWPHRDNDKTFSIRDNGDGMTEEQFRHRWRTLAYDRIREQGSIVNVRSNKALPPRHVFGHNGIGRFASFYFADEYFVKTWREGISNTFRVFRGDSQPIGIELVSSESKAGKGTHVYVTERTNCGLSANEVRGEIGMRFLTNPNFAIWVDRQPVAFTDIRKGQIKEYNLNINGVGQVQLIAIDTLKTDRTTRQHGVAWRVKTRLVGECSWKGHGCEELIDGRRIAAKRFTFIVFADCLENAVAKDWSGFEENDEAFVKAAPIVYAKIDEFLTSVSEQDRRAALKRAREVNRDALSRLYARS